jgi:hypothetical protein
MSDKTSTAWQRKLGENEQLNRRDVLRVGAGAALGSSVLGLLGRPSEAQAQGAPIRWDIISNRGGRIVAGGVASAQAGNRARITLTGSGTFVTLAGGLAAWMQGGGTWETRNPEGIVEGQGTYGFGRSGGRFELAPGTFPPNRTDGIADPGTAGAGLAVLPIHFSDGQEGFLVVSGQLLGTPPAVGEGITVMKGVVHYFNREPPVAGVDANRTMFHICVG